MRWRAWGVLWFIGRLVMALALLASTGIVTDPRSAQALAPTGGVLTVADQPSNLLFVGRGHGHGVGLCQWGARGRAIAGQRADEIVASYYPGTSVAAVVPREATVRVLVHHAMPQNAGHVNRVHVRDGAWRVEGIDGVFPPNSYLQVRMNGGGQPPQVSVHAPEGHPLLGQPLGLPITLHPGDPSARFQLAYPEPARTSYRGSVSLVPSGAIVRTINTVGIDDYLRGVVAAEMPHGWPIEALMAQLIASRSYAYATSRISGGRAFDFDATQSSQVYGGTAKEQPHINSLIDQTPGLAITQHGQVVAGFFSSTCSGWTENNEDVWSGSSARSYLRAIRDVDVLGQAYDAASPYATWEVGPVSISQLETALNADPDTRIGRLHALDLSRRTQSGRLTHVSLKGSEAERTVRAGTFLYSIANFGPDGARPLWSANFDVLWTDAPAVNGGNIQAIQPGAAPSGPQLDLSRTDPIPENQAIGGRYFSETGHHLSGVFRKFFEERGSIEIFGYPRTEAFIEDGITVQYFQRARFELHPDKLGTPYEVQFTLIGSILAKERGSVFPKAEPFTTGADHRYFPETGYAVHFAFKRFYDERDGLTILGYPISNELHEAGTTVQYFQRGRLEYHPELPTDQRVVLGLLGDEWLKAKLWLR